MIDVATYFYHVGLIRVGSFVFAVEDVRIGRVRDERGADVLTLDSFTSPGCVKLGSFTGGELAVPGATYRIEVTDHMTVLLGRLEDV
jgi:hypothetical protein